MRSRNHSDPKDNNADIAEKKQSTTSHNDKTSSTSTLPQQGIVMVFIGKWAMPTTVVLVLITCLSGYYLDVEAFTPVVGMIAPVIMALIMVVKEILIGKGGNEAKTDDHSEHYQIEKELELAKLALEEQRYVQEQAEKARQFDLSQAATKDVVELAREMNMQLVDIMKKDTPPQKQSVHIECCEKKDKKNKGHTNSSPFSK
ncbi:hypothetical protein BGP78_03050 [Pseudoalteromonas sp. MSK9-3]|uniref:hypothetical protein n=1 Tax=Pseudoalteromonas sp. MSK9-3 TaxID=1897633 RepID=UPI000E6BAB72|nr:hypothetical protein [Pseudoalteromonas sp. MSK9-3]RJE73254.1 hypothetical protein BGP78_03050 [Pseudoalteromonas sp. MSK9-3]